jgi:hypothetical protein
MQRQQKIILREMRESGPTRPIVYCADYKCAHSVVIDAGRWGDDVRLSGLRPSQRRCIKSNQDTSLFNSCH